MGLGAIPFLLAMVFIGGVAKAFGAGWVLVIAIVFASMIAYAFIMDLWNGKAPGSKLAELSKRFFGEDAWLTGFLERTLGVNQLQRDQDKDDKFERSKPRHS